MSVHKWIFRGRIKKHLIEVNHEPSVHELLIKLNGTQVIFEPDLQEEYKEYYLIIDNELCTLAVEEKEDGSFDYSLKPSEFLSGKRIISPEKKQEKQLAWAFSAVGGFFILIIFLALTFLDLDNDSNTLMKEPVATFGSVHYTGNKDFHEVIETELAYNVNNERYMLEVEMPEKFQSVKLAPNGMPVQIGDEFRVIYDARAPHFVQIFFNKPNEQVLQRYKIAATEKLDYSLKKYKNLKVNEKELKKYCSCIIEFVSKEFGVEGLASIYFLDVEKSKNMRHNYSSYKDLINNNNFMLRELSCRNQHLPELVIKE